MTSAVATERTREIVRKVDRYWREIGMPKPARLARRPLLENQVAAILRESAPLMPEIKTTGIAESWSGRGIRPRMAWAFFGGAGALGIYCGAITMLTAWSGPDSALASAAVAAPALAIIAMPLRAVWRAVRAPSSRKRGVLAAWPAPALLTVAAMMLAPLLLSDAQPSRWVASALVLIGAASTVVASRIRATWT